MSDILTHAEYRSLRTTLTRRTNKLRKAKAELRAANGRHTPAQTEAVLAAACSVIAHCDDALEIFESKGYPDSWSSWESGREDAAYDVRFYSDRW